MHIVRPTVEQIAARKWEIKRRYARKAKVGRRTRGMAAIRLAELTRWLDDTIGAGVELEPCDASVVIVRVFAHHMAGLPDAGRRIASWLADRAAWINGVDRERLIAEVVGYPLRYTADKLAWKIRLTDEQRTRLKIRTIGAIDCNKEQRKARRNRLKAEREKRRRAVKRQQAVSSI
jgi:hypothetical protein